MDSFVLVIQPDPEDYAQVGDGRRDEEKLKPSAAVPTQRIETQVIGRRQFGESCCRRVCTLSSLGMLGLLVIAMLWLLKGI